MRTVTWKETFYEIDKVSYDVFRVCVIISFICLSLWCLLSIVWALILSSRLHKDSKTLKIQTRSKHLMSGKEWDCLEKNYRLKRNKKVLMIILCVVEAIVSLLFISVIGHGMLNSQMFHQLGVYVIQPFEYPKMLFSLGFRLCITLVSCVVIIILSMVSLITKCLIQYYSYYSTNQKHPIRHGVLRLSL